MSWLRVVPPVRIAIPVGLVVAGLVCAGAVLASTAAWTVQPSPNPNPPSSYSTSSLNGVAATSSTNAWAVGETCCANGTSIIERWNGKVWKLQASAKLTPSPGTQVFLGAVAATSPTNAWAVGDLAGHGAKRKTLIEHWNGTAWTVQPSPNPDPHHNRSETLGVAATSSTNAWAVGDYVGRFGNVKTLIEHWNGKAWRVEPSPSITSVAGLNAVTATSSANAWAVGVYGVRHGTGRPLIEHWNGKAWHVAPSPKHGGALYGVAATSSTNAWAVGDYGDHGNLRPLIVHWNGKAWKVEPGASLPSTCQNGFYVTLTGVAATSSTNAWAVGECDYYSGGSGAANIVDTTVIEHWNGNAWKLQKSPNPVGYDDVVHGSAAVSSRDAWAVGDYGDTHGNTRPLILRWNGTG